MNADVKLFQNALLEGVSRKYEAELCACCEDASCSRAHLRRMRAILRGNTRTAAEARKQARILWVAAILAALLLSGCAAYVCREKLGEFFVTYFDNYVDVSFSENANNHGTTQPIAQPYTLTYVPEGYAFAQDLSLSTLIYLIWQDADGNQIIFIQQWSDIYSCGFDSEHSEFIVLQYKEQEIFCHMGERWNTYLWNNGQYALEFAIPKNIADNEWQKVFDGVVAANVDTSTNS